MFLMVRHYQSSSNHIGLYGKVEGVLMIFQTGAVLEIVHCAIGIVPSNVVLTAFQVFSRVFLVWGINYSVKESQDNVGFSMLLFAWTVTEIVRYSFYVTSLLGGVPYALLWVRYTFFLVLYPIGVSGELLCIYGSLPYVKKSNLYSYDLPNKYNISFSYYIFLWVIMFSYIPIFPQLFGHMLKQRKKIIGGQREKTA
ncbi:very-long-chain (3R)-3-hydroxyacyl-CoA dehydratase 2-like [Lineus longissimus]|uniref:very-long-chain (3R)-3-hydroxyacyl-CoA dehydratase 2-like n=1 Tax=Lineus longissimus TaxID=88925 RepID=UPI00315C61ED